MIEPLAADQRIERAPMNHTDIHTIRQPVSTPAADAYRKQQHATKAYAIRMPGGLYFGGFADPRKDPQIKVKWVSGLCEARLFGGNCYAQAEKYVERIKAKDSLYIGPKIVTVELLP
jgi:hypothetical protein